MTRPVKYDSYLTIAHSTTTKTTRISFGADINDLVGHEIMCDELRVRRLDGLPLETSDLAFEYALATRQPSPVSEVILRNRTGRDVALRWSARPLVIPGGASTAVALFLDNAEHQHDPSAHSLADRVEVLESMVSELQSLRTNLGIAVAPHRTLDLSRLNGRAISHREHDVVELLVSGMRTSNIARELYISENTVRNHLKSIYRKAGVKSQAELIEFLRGRLEANT